MAADKNELAFQEIKNVSGFKLNRQLSFNNSINSNANNEAHSNSIPRDTGSLSEGAEQSVAKNQNDADKEPKSQSQRAKKKNKRQIKSSAKESLKNQGILQTNGGELQAENKQDLPMQKSTEIAEMV